ncbi:MAG TPA: YCF48-related protein [Terriglobales bacterium]|nr:YCF48-related protein [Terriglobales bacterium]
MISESKLLVASKSLLFVILALCCASAAWAGQWTALGPDGGDVRSLAYDPQNPDHIFLGTSTGTLFSSTDGGHSWTRFAHLGNGDDYVIDHLAIDPQSPNKMYAAAWSVENQQAGDLFRSNDGGTTWETTPAMHGKSIRAMAIASSDSKTLVAGALDGVFRSTDSGKNWQRISSSNQEIHNIESIAVDPKNPAVVYAGTWHLAWKTDDGGASWHHINKGMIEDSDVFSIIVDSTNPSVVFASACSGIYKSQSAGDSFQKIQGIPFSARRTRVLKQDPTNSAIVYAGTTEGLWKTTDAGKTWTRVSNPDVVVNDVMVDPRNSQRVFLATDRAGVLASDDGAHTFLTSNHGYTHRYVTSILADKNDSNTLFVGVVNDRELGGVFASHDGGQHWLQKSKGLDGRDVFTLKQTSNGELVAGTNRGMFVLAHNASEWGPINNIINRTSSSKAKKGSKAAKTETRSILTARVNEIEITPTTWMAATSAGLFTSSNQGKSWSGGPVLGKQDFVSVQANGNLIALATRSSVLVSKDDGKTWQDSSLSSYVSSIRGVTITADGQIMFASREGAFRSPNAGSGWEHMQNGLPDKNISSISYDQNNNRLLATSTETGVVFESVDAGQSWTRGPDTGYPLRHISVVHGRFVAATPFDGVVIQPENDDRSASGSAAGRRTN